MCRMLSKMWGGLLCETGSFKCCVWLWSKLYLRHGHFWVKTRLGWQGKTTNFMLWTLARNLKCGHAGLHALPPKSHFNFKTGSGMKRVHCPTFCSRSFSLSAADSLSSKPAILSLLSSLEGAVLPGLWISGTTSFLFGRIIAMSFCALPFGAAAAAPLYLSVLFSIGAAAAWKIKQTQ